jgi:hypothetical protein
MKLKKYIKNNWWQPSDKWSILAVAIVGFLLFLLMRVEDDTYYRERLEMGDFIRKLLLDRDICKSIIDCQRKDYFSVSPYKSGISIRTYTITSKDVLMRITDEASTMFYSHEKMNIVMESYSHTMEESMAHLINGPDPFYVVEFRRFNQ